MVFDRNPNYCMGLRAIPSSFTAASRSSRADLKLASPQTHSSFSTLVKLLRFSLQALDHQVGLRWWSQGSSHLFWASASWTAAKILRRPDVWLFRAAGEPQLRAENVNSKDKRVKGRWRFKKMWQWDNSDNDKKRKITTAGTFIILFHGDGMNFRCKNILRQADHFHPFTDVCYYTNFAFSTGKSLHIHCANTLKCPDPHSLRCTLKNPHGPRRKSQ